MVISRKPKRILNAYQLPFFRPLEKIRGIFGDSKARIITLVRRSKRLNTTYLLKKIVWPIVDYKSKALAQRFFENWKASLKW